MAYTLGSLFTGIGGIDLAFQRVGFTISFQVEIDDYCNKILAKHWPNVARHRDVKTVGSRNLSTVDVLAGGFPCQDISAAGRGAGIKEGTRSGLWIEFARIIGEIRPRIVFLENVAAITSRDGTRVIADLAALGYDAEWGIIPAAAAGAAHRRERWWCVAHSQCTEWGQNDQRERHQERQYVLFPEGTEAPDRSAVCRKTMADSESVRDDIRQVQRQGLSATTVSREAMGHADDTRLQVTGPSYAASAAHGRTKPAAFGAGTGQTQSVLGRAVDGLSRGLDIAIPIAGPGEPQHRWEAPRTTSSKLPDRANRLKALGNAVYVPLVQVIAQAVREALEASNRLPD